MEGLELARSLTLISNVAKGSFGRPTACCCEHKTGSRPKPPMVGTLVTDRYEAETRQCSRNFAKRLLCPSG